MPTIRVVVRVILTNHSAHYYTATTHAQAQKKACLSTISTDKIRKQVRAALYCVRGSSVGCLTLIKFSCGILVCYLERILLIIAS